MCFLNCYGLLYMFCDYRICYVFSVAHEDTGPHVPKWVHWIMWLQGLHLPQVPQWPPGPQCPHVPPEYSYLVFLLVIYRVCVYRCFICSCAFNWYVLFLPGGGNTKSLYSTICGLCFCYDRNPLVWNVATVPEPDFAFSQMHRKFRK